MELTRKSTWMVLAAVLAAGALPASSAETPDKTGGYWGGYGMMGNGMGAGMMGGGYGMGPGLMGGGCGGYGAGGGMMGYGALDRLNLTDAQRTEINKVLDAERKRHWEIMGSIMDKQDKLRDLYDAEQPDPKDVGAAYGEISRLRQQMVELHVQSENQVRSVLTKEQRGELRQWNRDWHPGWGGGWAPGRMGDD